MHIPFTLPEAGGSRSGQQGRLQCIYWLSLWLFWIIVPVTIFSASSEFPPFFSIFSVLNAPRAETHNSKKPVVT